MLEKILGKKSQIKILRLLIHNENQEYYLDEIARLTGVSCGTIYPALKELLETRIIIQRKIGRSPLYKINKSHLLFQKIKELIDFEKKSLISVAEEFVSSLPKKTVTAVILFGSVARGKFTEKSDIDILLIYKNKKEGGKVEKIIDILLDKYDVHVVPLFLTNKEVQERIKKFDNLITTIINEGKLIYGEAPWLKK